MKYILRASLVGWYMEDKPNDDHLLQARPRTGIHEITLKRALGLIQTTFLGVGTAIGGVTFAIMGRAIGAAGPSIILTFLIGAFFALFVGLVYAELGAAVPSGAGGAVSFVRRAYGETIPTFLAGWFNWIGSITDCAIGAIVFAFSISYFLPWVEPFILAVITLLVFALINFRGTGTTAIVQFILTTILVLSLSLYIVGSFSNYNVTYFEPFFPKGFLPTIFMVSYIFPTYAGYETITQLSEEVKTAGKTIPRALLLTLLLISLLFTGIALATIGAAPPEVYIESATPLQSTAEYFIGPLGGILVSVGSIMAALTTINGSLAGGTRITYALSRSKLLPSLFKKVHPKYQIPYTSLALTTLLAMVFVLTRSVDFIVYAISLGYIVTGLIVIFALMRLRKTEPNLFRPFKVPAYPYIPFAAISILAFMLVTLSVESLILGVVLGIVGIVLLMLPKKIKTKLS